MVIRTTMASHIEYTSSKGEEYGNKATMASHIIHVMKMGWIVKLKHKTHQTNSNHSGAIFRGPIIKKQWKQPNKW